MKYRTYAAQKSGLTRAINSKDPAKVLAECRRVVDVDWSAGSPFTPYWPDDWSRWVRALEDAYCPARPPHDPFGGAL
ncbi:MAG: hypothetical protein VW239_02050 [Candidatus Nanopelagicales bacterium]